MSISTVTKTMLSSFSLLALLTLPAVVSAHSHVEGITINGEYFPGYPSDDLPENAPASSIAWRVTRNDNTFTTDYDGPDIICHTGATPGTSSATIAAGETVEFKWKPWPAHQGPVVDYMAACPGKCEDADKTKLEWFKIAERGLVSPTGCFTHDQPGCWALDEMRGKDNKWSVTVPSDLKAGNYVMRTEPMNLDIFGAPQNYPACINLVVTGGGSSVPAGVVGTSLYTAQDPGLTFNIYHVSGPDYPMPGPPMASGGGGAGENYGGVPPSPAPVSTEDTIPIAKYSTPPAEGADAGTPAAEDAEDDTDECTSDLETRSPGLVARRWRA